MELQADCFAGVWGHAARASLAIDDRDLKDAVNAAHAIGDDALGNTNVADYTCSTPARRSRRGKAHAMRSEPLSQSGHVL